MEEYQPDRIEFSANVMDRENGSVLPIRYTWGVPIREGVDANKVASHVYGKMKEWAASEGLLLAGMTSVTVNQSAKPDEIRAIKDEIAKCPSLDELDGFKRLAASNKEIRDAWWQRRNELCNPKSFAEGL